MQTHRRAAAIVVTIGALAAGGCTSPSADEDEARRTYMRTPWEPGSPTQPRELDHEKLEGLAILLHKADATRIRH